MDEMLRNCTWAQYKLPDMFVQNLMKSVKAKVLEFGRQKIKSCNIKINTKHIKLSDNVKKPINNKFALTAISL